MAETDGNSEVKNNSEKFLEKVKFEARTNWGPKGLEYSENKDAAIDLMTQIISRNNSVRFFHFDEKKHTPVFLIPLSSITYPPLSPKFDKQDTAMLIDITSRNTDRFKRDATFPNLIVMSKEDTNDFVNAAKEDPTIPFSLLRKLNNGPFKREAGDAAKLDQGTHLEFFHENGTTSLSKPFPQGFNPNPA